MDLTANAAGDKEARLLYLTSLDLVGQRVELTQADGTVVEGILDSFIVPEPSEPQEHRNAYVIKSARTVKDGSDGSRSDSNDDDNAESTAAGADGTLTLTIPASKVHLLRARTVSHSVRDEEITRLRWEQEGIVTRDSERTRQERRPIEASLRAREEVRQGREATEYNRVTAEFEAESQRMATAKEIKRLRLEQKRLVAREADRYRLETVPIDDNRKDLAMFRKEREAEEKRQAEAKAKDMAKLEATERRAKAENGEFEQMRVDAERRNVADEEVERENLAEEETARRLVLEQEHLVARENARHTIDLERIDTNRRSLADARAKREAAEEVRRLRLAQEEICKREAERQRLEKERFNTNRWYLAEIRSERAAVEQRALEASRLRLAQEGIVARETERQRLDRDRNEVNRRSLEKARTEQETMEQRAAEGRRLRLVQEGITSRDVERQRLSKEPVDASRRFLQEAWIKSEAAKRTNAAAQSRVSRKSRLRRRGNALPRETTLDAVAAAEKSRETAAAIEFSRETALKVAVDAEGFNEMMVANDLPQDMSASAAVENSDEDKVAATKEGESMRPIMAEEEEGDAAAQVAAAARYSLDTLRLGTEDAVNEVFKTVRRTTPLDVEQAISVASAAVNAYQSSLKSLPEVKEPPSQHQENGKDARGAGMAVNGIPAFSTGESGSADAFPDLITPYPLMKSGVGWRVDIASGAAPAPAEEDVSTSDDPFATAAALASALSATPSLPAPSPPPRSSCCCCSCSCRHNHALYLSRWFSLHLARSS